MGWGEICRRRCGAWAAMLLVLNLLDGLFTLLFLELEVATELNPLMRWAYLASPLTFMVVKQLAVGLGVLLLTLAASSGAARVALRMGTGVYGALIGYHLSFAVRLWT